VFLSKDSQATAKQCDFACSPKVRRGLISWTKLRIEPSDGSPGVEYRIEHGRVELRSLKVPNQEDATIEPQWQQLTPEELAFHVSNRSIVFHWLLRRLGLKSLIRPCNQDLSIDDEGRECLHTANLATETFSLLETNGAT